MRGTHALALAAMMTLLPAKAAAQETIGGTPADIAAEVHGIHQALDRLVGLLEQAQYQQRVELLLKRIELKERRLAPLEARLRSAEGQVEGLEDELRHLETMRESAEQTIDEEVRSGLDDPQSESRRMLEDLKRMVEPVTARLAEARLRMRRAEDDLLDGREEIDDLDAMLMELLETEGR
jgi:chromosome segregation ATPase